MSSDAVIKFTNVSKKYSKSKLFHNSLREQIAGILNKPRNQATLHEGEFWALRDINLTVHQGQCIVLAGPNGSGKSTILKLIARVTHPTIGKVQINTSVAPLIELGAGFHHDLTGMENIYMNGTILGMSIGDVKKSANRIIDFSGLKDFISVPVKKYSSGMYLRLAFSIAIHSPAETYLFDEVLAVGDQEFQQKCNERIAELKHKGKTVVIVSHGVDRIKHTIDRIISLRHGEIKTNQTNLKT